MDIQKIQMNNNISFLRIRPCDNNNEIYLNSRRKEGTSAFLIKSELELDINEIHKKDFQTLSKKSIAEVKYWLPPSIALACKSSFVLITPNKSFNSVPIKFCPPSPLVNER